MRLLISALIVGSLFSPTARAGEDSEILKSTSEVFLKTYVEAEAKKYADKIIFEAFFKELGKEAAQEATEEAGKKALGESVASTALSAYNFYQGMKNLDDAETDSQKYYASAQVAAAVVSYIFPPAGLIVTLAVVGAQLYGATIASTYAKTLAKLQAETIALYKDASDIQLKIIDGELEFIKKLFAELLTLPALLDRISEMQRSNCTIEKMETFEDIDYCITLVRIKRNYAEVRVRVLEKFINFNGQYINFDNFLEASKTNKIEFIEMLKQSNEQLELLNQHVTAIEDIFVRLMTDYFKLKRENNPEILKKALINECKNQQFQNIEQLLFIQKELNESDDVIRRMYIQARLNRTIINQQSQISLKCEGVDYKTTSAAKILDGILLQLKEIK